MSPFYLPLIAFVLVYVLWVLYLAVMALKRARIAGQLTRLTYGMGLPVLLVGYTLDAVCNVFLLSILLLEPPQELTVTARLKRHIRESQGWRLKVARWFVPLLDPFDPSGKHISE